MRVAPSSFLRFCGSFHASGTFLVVAVLALPVFAHASGPGEEPASVEAEAASETTPDPASDRPLRKFLGFSSDAAVAEGLWAEVGEVYRSSSTFVTSATAAYGWRGFEVGGDIAVFDTGDFDNLNLWAKYVGWKLGRADVGAGLLMEIPTSRGDFEAAPFAAVSLPVGEWDLRPTLGYVIGEEIFYNAACLRPIAELADFRAELDGSFDEGFDQHLVSILPGFDLHFVTGDWRILVRLSAGARVHPEARAIVGLSFVLTEI